MSLEIKSKNIIILFFMFLSTAGMFYYLHYYRLKENKQKFSNEYCNDVAVLCLKIGNGNDEVGVNVKYTELNEPKVDSPHGFSIDRNKNYYVLDSVNNRILKYNYKGQFINKYPFKAEIKKEAYLNFPFSNSLVLQDGIIYFIHKERLRALSLDRQAEQSINENEVGIIFALDHDVGKKLYAVGTDNQANPAIFKLEDGILIQKSPLIKDVKYFKARVIDNEGRTYLLDEKKVRRYDKNDLIDKNICQNNTEIQSSDYFYFAKFGYTPDNLYFYLIRPNANSNKSKHSILKTDLECITLDEVEVSALSLQASNAYIAENGKDVYISRLIIDKQRDLLAIKPRGRWIIEKYEFSK